MWDDGSPRTPREGAAIFERPGCPLPPGLGALATAADGNVDAEGAASGLVGDHEAGRLGRFAEFGGQEAVWVTILAAWAKAGSPLAVNPRWQASTSLIWWGSWLAAA